MVIEKIDSSRTRKDKPIESGNRNIIDIYVLGHAPYASENRVKGGLCLRPRREVGLGWIPVAEVKREGFYEAVMADKVSLRPHCRGLLRYCTQVTAQQYLFPPSYTLLHSPVCSGERLMPRFILSRLHISFIGMGLVYISPRLILPAPRDIRNSLEYSFNKYLKRQLIKITTPFRTR